MDIYSQVTSAATADALKRLGQQHTQQGIPSTPSSNKGGE
jgi:hypothetical protein